MPGDVQLEEPVRVLLETAQRVAADWLRRVTIDAGHAGGVQVGDLEGRLDAVVERASTGLLERLGTLLSTDVDEQRTTPLSLFREAVAEPNALLRECGARPPGADVSTGEGFRDDEYRDDVYGDDVYRLGPATWSDVDPDLHEPGLRWGAWKAMTVLSRRRDEGLR